MLLPNRKKGEEIWEVVGKDKINSHVKLTGIFAVLMWRDVPIRVHNS